jgi:hypothetical protein
MRYSYAFRKRRHYDLVRFSFACARCSREDQPMGLYSELERAHLDGDRENNSDENICVLCRTCHRALDYPSWAKAYQAYLQRKKEERAIALDAGRPILVYLAGDSLK